MAKQLKRTSMTSNNYLPKKVTIFFASGHLKTLRYMIYSLVTQLTLSKEGTHRPVERHVWRTLREGNCPEGHCKMQRDP